MQLEIARNPDRESSLPYLLRVPLGSGLAFRTKGTRPRTTAVRLPTAGAAGIRELEILVDAHERYAYGFRGQQVRTGRTLSWGERVRPATVADGLAEPQVRWPAMAVVFCENPKLAEEWTYRYLAAAYGWAADERPAIEHIGAGDDDAAPAGPPQPEPSTSELRQWARAQGLAVPGRGRLAAHIRRAWHDAHPRSDP